MEGDDMQKKYQSFPVQPFKISDTMFAEMENMQDVSGKKRSYIQVFKTGNFIHPDPEIGRFSFAERDFDQFIKNFKEKIYPNDLAVNLNHDKEEAYAWVVDLEKKPVDGGMGLFALVEWNESGINVIKEKKYRYTSAEFRSFYRDNESGKVYPKVLTGVALTNYPFIKGMEAVELSEPKTKKPSRKGSSMELSEIKMTLTGLGINLDDLIEKGKKFDSMENKVHEFSELKAKHDSLETQFSELKAENDANKKKLSAMEKEVGETKFNALVEKGLKDGKLTKAFAESKFKEMFDKMGFEFCESWLSEAPKAVHDSFSGSGGDNESKTSTAEAQLSEMAEKIVSESKGEINFSEALDRAMAANPKLCQEYEKQRESQMTA